ncbi:MAG TPA: cache domain-containing protein [Azospirillaceae bacterium]|nr:cache domain-containing protein [Azospirillaceae bacterium]HRQ80346.1 cache domain-containing protein [Azospirillaceae bacterium]
MKFSRSAPAVLIGAVAVVIAAVTFVSNEISHRMAASFEAENFALMGKIAHSKLSGAETKALSAAEQLAASGAVRDAFAARDKDGLYAVVKDAFAVQREKYGMSQAQFHLAPAMSFLRVHNPKRPAEDLSHYRQIVLEVNHAKAARKGIEITTSGLSVFGVLPMLNVDGEHIGSFEMGLELGPLLDELKKTYSFETALFIDEKMLRETATSLSADILNEQNRFGKFIKFYSTHGELLRQLADGDDLNVVEESHYLRDAAGTPYGVLLQPVYNYAKKQIGVLLVAQDFSATRSADGQAAVWQLLLGVVSVVVLIGVILIVVRGVLLRPLREVGDRVAALADGRDVDAVEVAGCDEVRDLAENVEKLRARLTAAAKIEGGAP